MMKIFARRNAHEKQRDDWQCEDEEGLPLNIYRPKWVHATRLFCVKINIIKFNNM